MADESNVKQDEDIGKLSSIVYVLEARAPGAKPRATIYHGTINFIAKALSMIAQYAVGILYVPVTESVHAEELYRGGDQYQQDGRLDDSRYELEVGDSDIGGFGESWKVEVVE